MRTTPYRTILETVLGLSGIPYSASTQDQREQVSNHLNMKMAEWYDAKPWPELLNFEERAFAAPWNSARTYVTGEVVWSTTEEAYYEAVQGGSNHAVTDSAYWAEADKPTLQVIEWEQYAQTKIGRVWGVFSADPRKNNDRIEWEIMLTDDGVVVPVTTANTVWIVFTKPNPRYTAVLYSGTANYSRYDIVFNPEEEADNVPDRGEVSELELDSNGDAFWNLVPFPRFMANGICYLAAADFCRFMGGKDQQAAQYAAQGEKALLDEWDKVRPLVTAWITEVA